MHPDQAPDRAEKLRAHLVEIRQAALHAVDPAKAVKRFLHLETGSSKTILHTGENLRDLSHTKHIFLAAAGKAAPAMAKAAVDILENRLSAGVVVTKYGHAAGYQFPETISVVEAGHPVPDQAGQQGADAIRRLLEQAREDDFVLTLLSGGASALLPLPVSGISLEDLQSLTGLLLRAGATIIELNTIRKHVDRLKGGQMARAASPAPLTALILSDVVGDPIEVIASGPTAPDPTTYMDTWNILDRYQLIEKTPRSIIEHLQNGLRGVIQETPKLNDPLFARVDNLIIGSNRLAAQAAIEHARLLGYQTLLLSTFIEGEASEIAKVAAALAKGVIHHGDPIPAPACLVWGGETTVTIHGEGRGGRNQELALAAALALDGQPGVAVMALATDGTDGPTDAAGGMIDGGTVARARHSGIDPLAALARNDSYPLLQATGDLMHTGPTGTNVNDLLVMLIDPA